MLWKMKKKLKKPRAWQAACCPNTVPVQDLFPLWFTVVKLGMLLREVYSCTSFFTSSHWTVTQEKYYMGHENDPFFRPRFCVPEFYVQFAHAATLLYFHQSKFFGK